MRVAKSRREVCELATVVQSLSATRSATTPPITSEEASDESPDEGFAHQAAASRCVGFTRSCEQNEALVTAAERQAVPERRSASH